MFNGLYNLFASTPSSPVQLSATGALNNASKGAKSVASGAIGATTECAKQLQILGEQLRGVAKLIDDNTPAVTQVAQAVVKDVQSTQTGQAALSMAASGTIQRGGRRGSVFSNAAITGGVRRYLKAASRTLKQLGGQATVVGQALPSAATRAAEILQEAVNTTVTPSAVEEATGAAKQVIAAANAATASGNSVLGTALPRLAVTQVPEPGKVVDTANQTAASILSGALNAAETAAQKGGYKRSMKGDFFNLFKSSNKTKKAGKKGKKGGFFTFTPFNPNAPSGQFEGFAPAKAASLGGQATRGGPVTTQTSVGVKVPPPPAPPAPPAAVRSRR